ncbi:zinc finger protein 513 isoform X1 [Bufo bufo]|uniref:zinc finger protein 513 isoform X1 n=2 Tax=Bufo bufo TaxID=8384 RepID=UPI001ABDD314|nr:zinc finger protein 513 isoform X1 [Bufo bufo]
MPRRKQSNPQPVKWGSEEPLDPSSLVLESDLLLVDELELSDSSEQLLSFSKDSEDNVVGKMDITCYSLSEDEYSGYQPLSADSDPEEAAIMSTSSPCEQCDPHSRCMFLAHQCLPCLSSSSVAESPAHLQISHPSLNTEAQKDRMLYPCRLCPFSTHYSSHLKRHMKTHNGEKPFRCPHCLYASAQLVNLKRHLRTHTGEKPFRCDHCSFSCSSPGNLKRHQRVHTQEKPFICNLCTYRCNQSRNLKRHLLAHRRRGLERQHQGIKKEEDEDDGDDDGEEKGSGNSPPNDVSVAVLSLPVTSNDLDIFLPTCALLSHAPPPRPPPSADGLPELLFPFTCRSCGMVLNEGCPQDEDEEDNVTEGHYCSRCNAPPPSGSPGKGFSCVLCSFVTHYPNHLSRHMKTHSGEKPYKCQLCSYASAHYDNLKRHQRVHTGEKPYKCQLCDYACGNLANLKRHGRIHSGDKPFRCGLCNYSCNQSMNLKRHMLRHTGEKPFRCSQCHYTTGHWDNYKRHQKTHGHCDGLSQSHAPLHGSIFNKCSTLSAASETAA